MQPVEILARRTSKIEALNTKWDMVSNGKEGYLGDATLHWLRGGRFSAENASQDGSRFGLEGTMNSTSVLGGWAKDLSTGLCSFNLWRLSRRVARVCIKLFEATFKEACRQIV
ncbi:hypothetical protein HAX54_001682 [Datura stramonium]|uniref:Uncharacterized protein n=1 Tax=Datura stramonium TaxID=4076 RepID=A0ABS8T3T0_DATST|nr:hypothetical protein [Datura stramonium]